VDWYGDVFDLVFPDVDAKEINTRWKKALRKKEKTDRRKEKHDKDEDDEDEDDDD
jgi:ATP-dependent Lon protease